MDYINAVNFTIDKGYEKSLEIYMFTTSNGAKTKKPTDPARMGYDIQKYNQWLESLGLKELFDLMLKKLL